METLEIEDLKNLLEAINRNIINNRPRSNDFFDYDSYNYALTRWIKEVDSLEKSRAIIEQMIKDREFEQSQTTLPKI